MSELNDILRQEIENFSREQKKYGINFDKFNDEELKKVLKCALNDALRDGARRGNGKYGEKSNDIVKELQEDYMSYIREEKTLKDEEEYKKIFEKMGENFRRQIVKHLGKDKFIEEGYLCKFVAMVFKYLYCFKENREKKKEKFIYCYMPLDTYTLAYYNTFSSNKVTTWYNIKKEKYFKIQEEIQENLLSKEYIIDWERKKEEIKLPKIRIEAEFIIWEQEKVNAARNAILKHAKYFDRMADFDDDLSDLFKTYCQRRYSCIFH